MGNKIGRLLIANRGEIAVRVARTAAEMGIQTVAIFATDDALSGHVRAADSALSIGTSGVSAYLDIERIVRLALESGCDAIHPGYGFLSENADFARACATAGVTFVGPTPETLDIFGDKTAARALATRLSVPVLVGTNGPTSVSEAVLFLESLGDGAQVMVKAMAGGGGRGMRIVSEAGELGPALASASRESAAAFGNGDVYVEQFLSHARHVEVQVVGDGAGLVAHLGERECTLQRRNQKVIEMAPSPSISETMRSKLCAHSLTISNAVGYRGVGTLEFLVHGDDAFFMEGNPRIQVEHTVTEMVTGIDIVAVQLAIASGASLDSLGLDGPGVGHPKGFAIQARLNAEAMQPDGGVFPASGMLTQIDMPSGPGVRVDTSVKVGDTVSANYDSLVAKVIVHSNDNDYGVALAKMRRALTEICVSGVATNIDYLRRVVNEAHVIANDVYTRFLDDQVTSLVPEIQVSTPVGDGAEAILVAPMPGTIGAILVAVGDEIAIGSDLVVMEAMKMEHVLVAMQSGIVQSVECTVRDTVSEGQVLVVMMPVDVGVDATVVGAEIDLDRIRPDLAEAMERRAITTDRRRPDAVERRRKTGQRTARENFDDLIDGDSLIEYGALTIAAQRRRRTLDDLITRTQADGMIGGIAAINGDHFGPDKARCVVMSYDYTVLAGTQGLQNHRKKDRLFELAARWRLPVVFFTEGGGGRPGDTDGLGAAGLDCMAFALFAGLSGLVPLIGINSGRCFAGNAAILGCCDVVIATKNSNIGMGGPAMIEGGGLGVYTPDQVGPMSVQVPNGVVDIEVADEVEAVAVAKKYLSYFQGSLSEWSCVDQRKLRSLIPENRLRVYDIRTIIEGVADVDSVLEIRSQFGVGMVTCFARVEGKPIGIIANNPKHLGGAIDSDGADKAARFMQLCDAYDVPLLYLCDTPGMMVGPEVEATALVRHCSRMFVTGASLTVPFFTIVLRKGYGLGAQAMAGGSFKAGVFTVAWPTGEFGGMGLEGAVKLGYRNELAAVENPVEREALFTSMVARSYEHGKAISTASYFEIDDVIDPAESRHWISTALRSMPAPPVRGGKKRPCIDTW